MRVLSIFINEINGRYVLTDSPNPLDESRQMESGSLDDIISDVKRIFPKKDKKFRIDFIEGLSKSDVEKVVGSLKGYSLSYRQDIKFPDTSYHRR